MILRVKKRPFYREIGREWLAVNSRALGPRGYMRVEFCTCVNLHAIALWLYILSFSLRSRFHCEQKFDKMNKCITILLGLLVFLIRRVKQRISINATSSNQRLFYIATSASNDNDPRKRKISFLWSDMKS